MYPEAEVPSNATFHFKRSDSGSARRTRRPKLVALPVPDTSYAVMMPTALLMLKAPAEGGVKTRLAWAIGVLAATRAYRRLVEHQLREIPAEWRTHICYAPANAEAAMRAWLGEAQKYSAQASGDLGERLAQATEAHFRSSVEPLIILGGDCPYLDTGRLRDAAAALTEVEAVLVPACDGGYCLIGLRRSERHLFHAISWSTGSVLAETRERLRERGLAWVEMEPLEDVDDGASWQRALECHPALGG